MVGGGYERGRVIAEFACSKGKMNHGVLINSGLGAHLGSQPLYPIIYPLFIYLLYIANIDTLTG